MPSNRKAVLVLALVSLVAGAASGEPVSRDWSPELGPVPVSLRGAGSVAWSVSFGSSQEDWVNKVIRLADGDFVAVGFVDRAAEGPADWDGVAHRFTADGRPLWTRRLGGPGLEAVWSVRETPEGRLALAGFSPREGATDLDLWLLVLDADGGRVLEQRYGGEKSELAFDVVKAPAGGFLLVGQTESFGAGERDVFLVRTDAGGREQWRRTFGGPQTDRGFYGVATADGGFVVAGVTGRPDRYDLLALKVDAEGREVWRQVIGGEGNDPSHGINLLPDGRVVVVGYAASWNSSEHDLVAVTLSPGGRVLSRQLMGGPGDDRAINSITGADGRTWLVGYTQSFGEGDWDVMVARLSPEGRFEPWMGAIGTPWDDHGASVVEAGGGALILGGYSHAPSQGAGAADLLIFSVDAASIERRTEGVVVREIPASGRPAPPAPEDGSATDRTALIAVMDGYVEALNRHDVKAQYAFHAPDMIYVDEGESRAPDREVDRAYRAFEAANDAVWSYRVVGTGPDTLEMVLTEEMEFYRLLGVGARSHHARYRFHDGKIVEVAGWGWTQEGHPYGETRDRFVAWLRQERPAKASRVTGDGGLRFDGETAPLINELVRAWRAAEPAGGGP